MVSTDYGDYPSTLQTWTYGATSYYNVQAQCSSGYASLGCYRDTRDRFFQYKSSSNNPGLDACAQECMSKGYAYMAYQNGNECWCGSTGEDYTKFGSSSACSNGLGGSWAGDVYHLVGNGCNTPRPTEAASKCSKIQAGLSCITSDNVVDVVFVLDSSSSISQSDYAQYKTACA